MSPAPVPAPAVLALPAAAVQRFTLLQAVFFFRACRVIANIEAGDSEAAAALLDDIMQAEQELFVKGACALFNGWGIHLHSLQTEAEEVCTEQNSTPQNRLTTMSWPQALCCPHTDALQTCRPAPA